MTNRDYPIQDYTAERRQIYLPPDIDLKSLKLKFKDVYQYPRVKDDLLFVPFADGRIECHNLVNNELVWTNATFGGDTKPYFITSDMQMLVYEDELLVALNDAIYILSIYSGACKNKIELSAELNESVLYGDILFIDVKEQKSYFLVALSLRSGEEMWRTPIPLGCGSKVVVGDALIVKDRFDEHLISYNRYNGKENWIIAAKLFTTDNAKVPAFYSNPFVMVNRLIASITDGHILCIDAVNAAILWKVKMTSHYVRAIPCNDEGIIYCESDSIIYCIDIHTGEIKNKLGIDSLIKVYSSPLFEPVVLTETQLILASAYMAPLVAINRKSGEIEQSVIVKKITFLSPFTAADRLFVLDQKLNLYISKPTK